MSERDDLLADAEIPIRTIPTVQPVDLKVAEAHRIFHHLYLRPGQQLDDLLTADAWRNSAFKLHVSDLIEVEPLDGSFHAVLLVRECSRDYARVVLLTRIELPSLLSPNVDDLPLHHSVEYLGPSRQFAAMHGTTVLRHGFSTRGDACEWLRSTLR